MTAILVNDSAALRAFIRALRLGRDISQRELADHLGLSLRAFQGWEAGETEKIDANLFLRAVAYLQGPSDLRGLSYASAAEGRELAERWLRGQGAEIQQEIAELQRLAPNRRLQAADILDRLADLADRGIALPEALRIVSSELR